ncbi:hypothetical protein QOT17_000322 [Balamuthia mandrillaris]
MEKTTTHDLPIFTRKGWDTWCARFTHYARAKGVLECYDSKTQVIAKPDKDLDPALETTIAAHQNYNAQQKVFNLAMHLLTKHVNNTVFLHIKDLENPINMMMKLEKQYNRKDP